MSDALISTDKSTWEHIGICRSYGARSSPMSCASCSVSAAGSTVSCPTSTAPLDPPDPTRLAGWATRLSRVSAGAAARLHSTPEGCMNDWSPSLTCFLITFEQATSSTVSVCAVEAVNAPCPRVPPMASLCTTVSTRSSSPAACSPLLRYVHCH